MDILRIERTVALHRAPRGSPGSGHVRWRAGPSVAAPGRAIAQSVRKPSETTSFPFGDTSVRLSYDKEIGRIVMHVLDKDSATVVKRLPSEEAVAFLRRFRKAVALLVGTGQYNMGPYGPTRHFLRDTGLAPPHPNPGGEGRSQAPPLFSLLSLPSTD